MTAGLPEEDEEGDLFDEEDLVGEVGLVVGEDGSG